MIVKHFINKKEVALNIAQEVFLKMSHQGVKRIAISGGSTPKLLFEILSTAPFKNNIRWENIHLFWVDERCVSPDDAESNYGMVAKTLLRHIVIPIENIHRIRGEAEDISAEAKRCSEEVLANSKTNRQSSTLFDVALMGMGEDGHTASIFPDQMDLLNSKKIYEISRHPQSGQSRIGLTGEAILKSNKIIFMITGNEKKDLLMQVLSDPTSTDRYPAANIMYKAKDLEIYTDIAVG